MPINKDLFKAIKEKFFERLNRKTGWGKEEVKQEYINATNEVLVDFIESTEGVIK